MASQKYERFSGVKLRKCNVPILYKQRKEIRDALWAMWQQNQHFSENKHNSRSSKLQFSVYKQFKLLIWLFFPSTAEKDTYGRRNSIHSVFFTQARLQTDYVVNYVTHLKTKITQNYRSH